MPTHEPTEYLPSHVVTPLPVDATFIPKGPVVFNSRQILPAGLLQRPSDLLAVLGEQLRAMDDLPDSLDLGTLEVTVRRCRDRMLPNGEYLESSVRVEKEA